MFEVKILVKINQDGGIFKMQRAILCIKHKENS